jgi:hypothetical protein
MSERRTDDATLIAALRILARDIQSGDGCANACLLEAAIRLEELVDDRRWIPVGERLPDADLQVLWLLGENQIIDLDWTKPYNATHWQPLPPGPEDE